MSSCPGNWTGNIEHENVDRVDTAPPGLQMPFAQAVLKKATAQGTPVVLVMAGIGTLAVDELVDGACKLSHIPLFLLLLERAVGYTLVFRLSADRCVMWRMCSGNH